VPPSDHTTSCTTPLTAREYDPAVRNVTLQRDPDGGGLVTMCLVSRQKMVINPSASIGIFGRNGVLAGTAAKAMPGKFQPASGDGLTIVRFVLDVPSDPPLPTSLQTLAMIQLAWDTCPDDACAKPSEQSLALLEPLKTSGGADHERTAAIDPPAPAPKPAAKHSPHHKHHAAGSVAAGGIY
jgi:hypothetical protein